MKESWKRILQEMITLLQEYQNTQNNISSAIILRYETAIKQYFIEMSEIKESDGFFRFLYQEFGNESELYPLMMSVLFKCTREERCLQEVMRFLTEGKVDIFHSIGIRHQIESGIFNNSKIGQNYDLRRKVHETQLNQLNEFLGVQYSYIPWEQRNNNLIVVVTNQLLLDQHAPTRNVKDICCSLMDMGKEVILIVATEKDNIKSMFQYWLNPASYNYLDDYNGNFLMDYYQNKIRGYQILLHNDNKEEIIDIMDDVYKLKPLFIWYMGGTSLFADMFRNCTTVISMPFTDGYSVSEAPVLLEYMKSSGQDIKQMQAYIAGKGQEMVHFRFEQIIRPSIKKYKRQDYDIPEDCFAVAVVGNRLNAEVNDAFINVLNQILVISNKIHLVFIGSMNPVNTIITERVTYIAFHDDLIGLLSLMDLFVNPPRKGGGTGAYWSLYNSIPIVTLGNCDVANCVTEEFICRNEDEMVLMTEKHFCDKEYHKSMRKKAKEIINEIEKVNDIQESIRNLINEITVLQKDRSK